MAHLLSSPNDGRGIVVLPYNAPAGPGTWPNAWPGAEPDGMEPGVPLAHYLWLLKRHCWKIAGFVFTCVIATLIVSARLTPIYESTATVDIDRRAPAGILGQEASQNTLNDADQFLATQVKLVQSDSVLRPVVERFKLKADDWDSAREAEASDAPIRLKRLKIARPPNTYLLLISYRSEDPRLASEVANAIAQSYIEHTYDIRYRASAGLSAFMEKQLEELKAKMERSGAALARFERELNVINPEEKTSILSARLLQLNAEYTNAQADRMRKQAASDSIRTGSRDAAQVSTQADSLKPLSDRLNALEERFAQVQAQYGANHPEYRKAQTQLAQVRQQFDQTVESVARRVEIEYQEAAHREQMLQKAVAATKAEFDRLNARSFEYRSLKQEAEADKRLYEELVTRIKEAGINAGFQNSAIRLADSARPAVKPVFPNVPLNLALAFFVSSVMAIGVALVSDVADRTIRDAEQVRRMLNTEVIGSLPLVKSWRGRLPAARKGERRALIPLSSSADQNITSFEEAVRTLRNAILLGQFNAPLKSILLTSATPGEGKTTTAIHLALAHAQQSHKTLLIDADLRRPSVQNALGINPDSGLAAALCDGLLWRDKLIQLDEVPDLDILAAGPSSRRAVDLIGRGLPQILEQAVREYDLVIVDAPPLLGFAEPLQIATLVDGVVIVSLAAKTNRKAVASVVNTLKRLHANVVGVVLNEMTGNLSDGYHHYSYGKYYKYYRSEGADTKVATTAI